MTRQVGDVKHGYVESAWGQFEILGDRKGTLKALKLGARREPQKNSPTARRTVSTARRVLAPGRVMKVRRAPERNG